MAEVRRAVDRGTAHVHRRPSGITELDRDHSSLGGVEQAQHRRNARTTRFVRPTTVCRMSNEAPTPRARLGRPGQAVEPPRGHRGSLVAGAWHEQATYRFDRSPAPATRSTRSTPRRRRCRARSTSVTSSPTPTPTPSPAISACGAKRSSTRSGGTTTACPPSAACRTSTACCATRRSRTTRRSLAPDEPFDPPRHISRQQLRRAVPRSHRRGRKGVRGAVARTGAVGRLGAELRDHRRPQPTGRATRVPTQPRARRGLPSRSARAVGRRLRHRGRAGRARGSREARARTTASRSGAPTAIRSTSKRRGPS